MDPISAILLLGASAAVAASAERQLHARARTQHLKQCLGMAVAPSTIQAQQATAALPDRGPDATIPSLWETFRYQGMRVSLVLNQLDWMGSKADLDETIHHAGYSAQGLGYWQVDGEPASKEPRSLWDLMHRAWLGRTPPLIIDLRYNSDGQNTIYSAFSITAGSIELEVRVVGEEIESEAKAAAGSWLDVEDQEIAGDTFVECFIDKTSEMDVHGHYFQLGHIDDTFFEDTFSGTMAAIVEAFHELEGEVDTTQGQLQAQLNEFAKECTEVALEEVDAYRKTYELEHGDDEDDDWDDEDDDDDEWDDEDDEDEDDEG